MEGDDRPEVQDILIVFTDGATRDQNVAMKHADLMKARNCEHYRYRRWTQTSRIQIPSEEIASSPDDVYFGGI